MQAAGQGLLQRLGIAPARPVLVVLPGSRSSEVRHLAPVFGETLALLKILALGEKEVQEGKTVPAADAMRRVRERIKARQSRK